MSWDRASYLIDTELPVETPSLARLKGEPFVVFRNQSVDAISDGRIAMSAYNALVIKVLVSGRGPGGVGPPSADVLLLDSEVESGIYLPCTDPQGDLLGVTAPTQYMVVCGAHYARIQLENVSGQFQDGEGYTVICWPFVAAGQSTITSNVTPAPGVTLPADITQIAGVGIGLANPMPIAGPVTSVDGGLATVGALADAAVVTDAAGTLSAKLRGLVAILAGLIDAGLGLAIANQLALLATTAANLGGAATYTQATVVNNAAHYGRVTASVFSDVAGTLFIEQSADSGTTWDVSSPFTTVAGAASAVSVEVIQPTVRLRYLNGATPQTTFRLTGRLRRV